MAAPPGCTSSDKNIVILMVVIFVSGFYTFLLYSGKFGPDSPIYSIDSISVKNFNVSSPISEFDVTVRAENPNDKTVIYYLPGSSVSVFHNFVRVWSGALPVFLQGRRNVTFLTASLTGALADVTGAGLVGEDSRGTPVELRVVMKIPMRLEGGPVKSWKTELLVYYYLTVKKLLTTDTKIVPKECRASLF